MRSKRIAIWVAVTAALMALACGGSSGESQQVGVYSAELVETLHSDPRFESSRTASGLANDADGNTVEFIDVIMPDENCPGQTYESCEDLVLDLVRLMLTTPHVDHFTGISVTLVSFLPRKNPQTGQQTDPGKPPLANKTLEEWREIVGENQ